MRSRRGMTLAEVMIVVAMLGFLALIAIPIFSGTRAAAEENAAMQTARLVNSARDSFGLTIPDAATQWAAAADDTARIQLLITAVLLPGAPADYLTMPGGYSIQLTGAVRSRSILLHGSTPDPY